MKKIGNTNIKVYSKVSELASATADQIFDDIFDYNRAQTVANGVVVSNRKGSRRIVDNARNKIAHEVVDYSQFKIVKIEAGVTVDNKKEREFEEMSDDEFFALMNSIVGDDSNENDSDDSEQESDEQQTVENEEPQTVENEPAELDSLLAEVTQQEIAQPKAIKKARTFADIVNHPYVESVEDCRDCQEGIWISLKKPYYNPTMQLTMIHEDTVAKCCDILNNKVRIGTSEELEADY